MDQSKTYGHINFYFVFTSTQVQDEESLGESFDILQKQKGWNLNMKLHNNLVIWRHIYMYIHARKETQCT